MQALVLLHEVESCGRLIINNGLIPRFHGDHGDAMDYRAAVRGRKTELGGVLWSQGAADAKLEASAHAYAENIQTLIESFRKDLDVPELPFFIGGARPHDPSSDQMKSRFPHLDLVRAAFVNSHNNVPHTHLVPTLDLHLGADGLHYDTVGQVEFGKRFAAAYLAGHGEAGDRR